jgi:hypothetical protein
MLTGNFSQINVQSGALIEYADTQNPLELIFEFNPTTITRTRSITLRTGEASATRGGYDFQNRKETVRAAQSVTVNAESLTLKILLDATDRMNEGNVLVTKFGVQPELDIIRSMLEPKAQTPQGARTLAAIGQGNPKAFSHQQYASVLLFCWGVHILPVFMTQAQIDLKEFLPNLIPYRAEATLTLQIIESNNPFYIDELKRQLASASQTIGTKTTPSNRISL